MISVGNLFISYLGTCTVLHVDGSCPSHDAAQRASISQTEVHRE